MCMPGLSADTVVKPQQNFVAPGALALTVGGPCVSKRHLLLSHARWKHVW